MNCVVIYWQIISEYNTDEETDELLERQYNVSERNNAQTAEANGPDTLAVQVLWSMVIAVTDKSDKLNTLLVLWICSDVFCFHSWVFCYLSCSEAHASAGRASDKLGEKWVIDWVHDLSSWASAATEAAKETKFGTKLA